MKSIDRYNEWLEKVTDRSLHKQLEKMADDPVAIENAFYKELEFGTGGMRGILGVGTNCLNIYNIRKVTEGVARAMDASGKTSVAISRDSRHMSEKFAKTAAEVFGVPRHTGAHSARRIAHAVFVLCRAPLRLRYGRDGDGEPQSQTV